MLILLFIILWLVIWNCLTERKLEKVERKLCKNIKILKKNLKNIENTQEVLFDYINSIYSDLERIDSNEKN